MRFVVIRRSSSLVVVAPDEHRTRSVHTMGVVVVVVFVMLGECERRIERNERRTPHDSDDDNDDTSMASTLAVANSQCWT